MSEEFQFGPVWTSKGVQFRLWAPDAKSVRLCLNERPPVAMSAGDRGWYNCTVADAKAGDTYYFLVGDNAVRIPDPASWFQPMGTEGASELVKPSTFRWTDEDWKGRPWEEAVIYELHTGCFTEKGTYKGVEEKLDYLSSLGMTAIELMPVADFAGQRGWGYDGVLPFAPHEAYGRPEDLKHLIDRAHAKGIMVFLDVVYNHFGPAGNFLNVYAKEFFTEHHHTPWGVAINFEGSREVRDFFLSNALYWLEEYHFDGLRLDAVHAIKDSSEKHFLYELAEKIRATLTGRQVHLILENDRNESHFLTRDGRGMPDFYTAQWDDDIHHVFHVLLTGEKTGYYEDYADDAFDRLERCLTEGFAYQGEPSLHRHGEARGEPTAALPPAAFVSFLQNHDQIGNRAMGERLCHLASPHKLRLAQAIMLLSPQPPMLFMGEEWAASSPFLYFCDFHGELAKAVREGRRKEFKSFSEFSDPEARLRIPDPNARDTFEASRVNWHERETEPYVSAYAHTQHLIALRRKHILPLLKSGFVKTLHRKAGPQRLNITYLFKKGEAEVTANFSDSPMPLGYIAGEPIWGADKGKLDPWECCWVVRHYE